MFDSQYIKHYNKEWWCIKCFISLFNFTKSNNHKIFSLLSDQSYRKADTDGNCLLLKPIQNMSHLLNEFDNFMSDPNSNLEKYVNCKNYNISQIKNLKTCKDKRSLLIFHLISCSLLRNIDDFQYTIQSTIIAFHVIAISGPRILKNKQSVFDINVPSYSYEFC